MLKTLLLDLDETLCDTTGANNKALRMMAEKFCQLFPALSEEEGTAFSQRYLKGIYRELNESYQQKLLPVTNEEQFRLSLISLILDDMSITDIPEGAESVLQQCFDDARTAFFDFFPGIETWLASLREHFTLGVITNGPEFSQRVKVERVNLKNRVDFFLIGGLEPEQKPAKSIFEKALRLANCEKHQALHIGDSLAADIQGANNAGIDSVWISHGQELPDNSSAQPTHIIETPFQLPELIKQLKRVSEAP
ncbi:MAG: HAD-IA family hydrolase [Pseudomonadales bacterium]|nr:HAD-IA family hydrolase [Pseudomonadales bacterium]